MTITANSGTHTHLPVDEPSPLLGVLGSCVELQATATRADLEVLADHTDDPDQQAALRALAADDERYRTQVREPNLSVLDLLDRYPGCAVPFRSSWTCCRRWLRGTTRSRHRRWPVRTPCASPKACWPNRPGRAPAGTTASAPTTCPNGRREHGLVVFTGGSPRSRPAGRPAVPMIMVGPNRIRAVPRIPQERAAQAAAGPAVAPSLLFFGCRTEHDRLYPDELAGYAGAANVTTYTGVLSPNRAGNAGTRRTRCWPGRTRSGP